MSNVSAKRGVRVEVPLELTHTGMASHPVSRQLPALGAGVALGFWGYGDQKGHQGLPLWAALIG
jgi:hypothetical protein